MFGSIGNAIAREMATNGLTTAEWAFFAEKLPALEKFDDDDLEAARDGLRKSGIVHVREGFGGDLSGERWQDLGKWLSYEPTLSELASLFRRIRCHGPGLAVNLVGYEAHVHLYGALVEFEVKEHRIEEGALGDSYDEFVVLFTVKDECRVQVGSDPEEREFHVIQFGFLTMAGPCQKVRGNHFSCARVTKLNVDEGELRSIE